MAEFLMVEVVRRMLLEVGRQRQVLETELDTTAETREGLLVVLEVDLQEVWVELPQWLAAAAAVEVVVEVVETLVMLDHLE
jgi:hypothetical protein